MKRIILLIFLSTLLYSCKTYKIQEKWVFIESKYDAKKFYSYIERSDLEDQDKSTIKRVVDNLINTDNVEIYKNEDVSVNRKYIQINDSIKLEYFEFQPKIYSKSGLFFIGNGSNVLSTYKELEKLAIETKSKIYVLNYRGYGKSEGTPSFKTVFEDNNSFLKFIESTNENIDFVIGYSLGSISATYLAVDNAINNLILLAPLSNADEMLSYIKTQQMKGLKSVAKPLIKITAEDYLLKLSNTEKISSYHGRLIVSHAIDDKALPFKMGKGLFDACPSLQKELIKIEKGGHGAPFKDSYWKQIISDLNNI
ncbi:alpha/beta hydrolase [Bacteroidia bacterium]|nr:alpha/beta hydrolase [Bacteroidia bacterium]